MLVSIITPSFNQAKFINRTLVSVEGQSYKQIEHIVQDGISTDGTVNILQDYSMRNEYVKLHIESDDGQVSALNRGFEHAKGEIICWLNTDDFYADENVLSEVVDVFRRLPDIDVVYGRGSFVNSNGVLVRDAYINHPSRLIHNFFVSVGILQPGLFFRSACLKRYGFLNPMYSCAFDYEYWIRLLHGGAKFQFIDRCMVLATFHEDAKSSSLRSRQLLESAELVRLHYGCTSLEWVERVILSTISGINGIINRPEEGKQSIHIQRLREMFRNSLFKRMNSTNDARQAILLLPEEEEYTRTKNLATKLGLIRSDLIFATTFDDAYLEQGITLIHSLRVYEAEAAAIVVYDLRLSDASKLILGRIANVHVVPYPSEAVASYPDYLSPKNYGYKCAAIQDASRFARFGGTIIWIDAGVAPIASLEPIYRRIEEDDVFFVNHDDKGNWPFFNGTFCHPEAAKEIGANLSELLGEHLCSCLVGYKKGGKYAELFRQADLASRNRLIVAWEKHPVEGMSLDSRRSPNPATARRFASRREEVSATECQPVHDSLGYLGHRQDQTIYSILVARFQAPISSAVRFCRSDDESSRASKLNWESGSASPEVTASKDVPAHIRGAITYHHRGTFTMTNPIETCSARTETLAILGNGPSLRGFDFERLRPYDCIGMNAAYRYWDEIGWYPRFYICLDRVVGVSHLDQIQRLIRERDSNGIEFFLLRQNLIDEMDEACAMCPSVISFDKIKTEISILDTEPITTGSHSALFGYLLGYQRIVLLGIDCNYVEIIDGAKAREGTVLEVVETPKENPNYFFANYQVAGDKYNIPNPTPSLHIDAWRAVGVRLKQLGVKIWNCSAISNVDAFPNLDFAEIEADDGVCVQGSMLVGPFARVMHAHIDETKVVAELMRKCVGNSHLMIDVGAHVGSALAPFLQLGWYIQAFEPDSSNRAKLESRLDAHPNGRELVSIDTRAVTDRSGSQIAFYSSEVSTGISGLSSFHPSHHQTQLVDTITLTEFAQESKFGTVDFLKIDTEGHDFFVLKGYPWHKGLPAVVECEFEDAKTVPLGYSFKQIGHFLLEKGYHVYLSEWHPIIRYGVKHDWCCLNRYPCDLYDDAGWGNFLAFREDIDPQRLRAVIRRLLFSRQERQPSIDQSTAHNDRNPHKAAAFKFARTLVDPSIKDLGMLRWSFPLPHGEQKHWVAVFDAQVSTTNNRVIGTAVLTASCHSVVRVQIARHSDTPYEGSNVEIHLSPSIPTLVIVEHRFLRRHGFLKFGVELLRSETLVPAEISIQDVLVASAVVSGPILSFAAANRLFRSGAFDEALDAYLRLWARNCISIYADNAVRSARRIGLLSVTDIKDLLPRFGLASLD